jgi:hypothetical protein
VGGHQREEPTLCEVSDRQCAGQVLSGIPPRPATIHTAPSSVSSSRADAVVAPVSRTFHRRHSRQRGHRSHSSRVSITRGPARAGSNPPARSSGFKSRSCGRAIGHARATARGCVAAATHAGRCDPQAWAAMRRDAVAEEHPRPRSCHGAHRRVDAQTQDRLEVSPDPLMPLSAT